ncbi:MAG TPA: MOSC N-terminal beta barrel domain-containing protein [Hymenobacter sp.]|uniref:MOSC domain-containing protein n=1 Tax=Hymenobacter sp. TaxID=1898978 RepID=UPI002D803CA6|nr:MOSC N-terminal beta barrel domain-containing protein [Hymenobacter sp.]HET9502355.1 MOSC N-terminal beta barrel domain-containing protein [Hymenobacter sp.]
MSALSSAITLSGIFIYPVKSLGGISLPAAELTPRGLRHDRRWLIVDERNRFLTQREHAEMALLAVEPAYNGFLLRHRQRPELLPLYIPFEAAPDKTLFVTIWDDMVFAWRGTPEADAWLSEALGRACKLVYMSDMVRRDVDADKPELNPPGTLVSFADGYPYLLASEESLEKLNAQLAEPVPMDRFRPNLVVRGLPADAERQWADFQIAGQFFRAVRECGRCVVTTIDQATAEKNPATEPLRTLATYRKVGNKTMFGQNVTGPASGLVRVGDIIEL